MRRPAKAELGAADPDRVQWIVLGVGVNVNARAEDFPDDVRPDATSILLERGQAAPRALFAAACFTALEGWLDRYDEDGFAAIREEWRARSATLGREVSVRLDDRELVGIAEDLDEGGALLVRTPSGLERIFSGEVRMLRPR